MKLKNVIYLEPKLLREIRKKPVSLKIQTFFLYQMIFLRTFEKWN